VAALSVDAARATASAFAVYFDLVNLAEEAQRIQALRERERSAHPAPIGESIGAAIREIKSRGVTPERMAALLGALRIELVLTAHPTEAKRRTVLSKLQRIGEMLRSLHDPDLLPRERDAEIAALRAEITALWLTERSRTARPAVTDEVRTGLYFVEEVFWGALPRMYRELEAAVAEHYPGLAPPARWLTLASWIGGDRDGNPSVVTPVTAETLRLHRGLAVEQHRRALHELGRRLSMSGRRCPAPPALTAWLDARRPLPAHVAYLERRYGGEPYRLALALLAADLEAASQVDMTARLLDETPHQARVTVESIQEVLDMIAGAIPQEVAADYLRTVRIRRRRSGCTPRVWTSARTRGASPPRSAACSMRSASTRASRSGMTPTAPRCSCASCRRRRPRRPTWPWPRSRPRRAPRPGGSSASSRACGASIGRSRSGRSSSR
jgi:phosphoenolpyruvate carboxylase